MSAWGYTWKSSDGVRHEDTVDAASRDEVFARLRTRGIRPIKVFERGQAHSGKSRWRVVALVATGICLALTGLFWGRMGSSGRQEVAAPLEADGPSGVDRRSESDKPSVTKRQKGRLESNIVEVVPGVRAATPRPRMHLDVSSVTNLNEVFRFESERYLVRFACPGAEVPSDLPPIPDDLYDALESDILIQPDEPVTVVKLKRIVAGLKEDARRHLSVGADLEGWTEFLVGRQRMEAEYRERIIENFADDEEEMHRRLRAMGFE